MRDNLMDHQSDMEDWGGLQANPSATMKTKTMIIPTPSKIEITGKRRFLGFIEVKEEDSQASKRQKIDSGTYMVEVGSKKMK